MSGGDIKIKMLMSFIYIKFKNHTTALGKFGEGITKIPNLSNDFPHVEVWKALLLTEKRRQTCKARGKWEAILLKSDR